MRSALYRCGVGWGLFLAGAVVSLGQPSPAILQQPASQAVVAGTDAGFSVMASGNDPLSYSWFHDGALLSDNGRISGTASPSLQISTVSFVDAGIYHAVVSNKHGTATSSGATLTVLAPPLITTQPTSQSVLVSNTAVFQVSANGSAPLSYQWQKDGVDLVDGGGFTGVTGPILNIANAQAAHAGVYQVSVANPYGNVVSRPVLLSVAGQSVVRLDPSFSLEPDGAVSALAVQPDGRLIIGGDFAALGGAPRDRLARLRSHGGLDSGFAASFTGGIGDVAVQPSGYVLVGGGFNEVNGWPVSWLCRFEPSGVLDTNFSVVLDGAASALAVQPDGSVILCGYFRYINGQYHERLARLHPDGTLDSSFGARANNTVYSVAAQQDGGILVGGYFGSLNVQTRRYLGRLNADGSLDEGFDPGVNQPVNSIAVQPDGKILICGGFTTVGEQERAYIARVLPGGTLDLTFNPDVNGTVYSLCQQADGRIVIGGSFTTVGGLTRQRLARLNPDGTVDPSFVANVDSTVTTLALAADGKLFVGGVFSSLGGQPVSRFCRLLNTEPAQHSLHVDPTQCTWLLGGTTPQLANATLWYTENGESWTTLGAGSPVPDGWIWANSGIPEGATLRAFGVTSAGYHMGSSSLLDEVVGSPAIIDQPDARTHASGTVATLFADVDGTPPLTFQWYKNGVALTDVGNVTGATTSVLELENVLGADDADYVVVVTNAFGSVTSQVARITVLDPFIHVNPVSVARELGETAGFDVGVSGTAPVSYQWFRDGISIAGVTTSNLMITNLRAGDAGAYEVIVSNTFGSVTSEVALLSINLTQVDAVFQPHIVSSSYDGVESISIQPEGDLVIGGDFYRVNDATRNRLARIAPDGSLDPDFDPGASGDVYSLALQSDRRILVGGNFYVTSYGIPRGYLGRLNPDGSVDEGFSPGGAYYVFCVLQQPDQAILVAGTFSSLGGEPRTDIGRLFPDGSLDLAFAPDVNGWIKTMALQEDGRIVVGGQFDSLGGQPRTHLGRLNADGTLDASFNVEVSSDTTTPDVQAVLIQADGKIVVGGRFSSLAGQPRENIGRLNPDGTLDETFNPGADNLVYSMAAQVDGKVILAGAFTHVAGAERLRVARLKPDGALDATFNPGADSLIWSVAIDGEGCVLMAGYFAYLDGQRRYRLGRVLNNEAAVQSLERGTTHLTWLRAGACPEVSRTTFEHSADGISWGLLGSGSRIPGGWELSGTVVPLGGMIRARGVTHGGYYNASSGMVEFTDGELYFAKQPVSQTNDFGATVSLSAYGGGTAPLIYRWYKDGLPLQDGPTMYGSGSATLTISGAFGGDSGLYTLVLANGQGSLTSQVARVWVNDPVITTQPAGLDRNAGITAVFSVQAIGTDLRYQWMKDGAPVPQGTNASLTLLDTTGMDAGDYWAIVSGPYGAVTSAVAVLTVTDPVISNPPDSAGMALGSTFTFYTTAHGLEPLTYQWWKDGFPLAGATNPNLTLPNLVAADAGYYSIVVSNAYGMVASPPALLTINLVTRDLGWYPSTDGNVYAVLPLPDGKTLIGGSFNAVRGQIWGRLARLNADGTLDTTFYPLVYDTVYALALQPDGKVLVGGKFITIAGQSRAAIARLNADGTLDPEFNPAPGGTVYSITVDSNGRIVVGGSFAQIAGQTRHWLARLESDGTLDSGFDAQVNSIVRCVLPQDEGKLLIGGSFTLVAGESRQGLARLNSDGTLDSAFNHPVNNTVYALAPEAGGRILLGGAFTTVSGQPRSGLARFNASGNLDPDFHPSARTIYSIAPQADGSALVGGALSYVDGISRDGLARLRSDGSLDPTFDPLWTGAVYALALQADGQILIGGSFRFYNQSTAYIARLSNTIEAMETFTYDGTTLSWQRGGSSPEAWRTTFDLSLDGTNWTELGEGVRAPGGWVLTNSFQPAGATVRARAHVLGGYGNGSAWLVERWVGAPTVVTAPQSVSADYGETVSLTVKTSGIEPFGFHWFKDGQPLNTGGEAQGGTLAELTLPAVTGADAGSYQVIVTNHFGSVTSVVAVLEVADPLIVLQPENLRREVGETAEFEVRVVGTDPGFQWYRDHMALPSATNALLTLTNVQRADAGVYSVVVSNGYHSVTSAPVSLVVNLATVDPAFSGAASGGVYTVIPQPDGKLVLGGYFTSFNGSSHQRIVRVNPDGSVDPTFQASANSSVRCLALDEDGKIIVGGSFTVFNGQNHLGLVRLNRDGSLDDSFGLDVNGSVYVIARQPDGRLLVGGYITSIGGHTVERLARINLDGTPDGTFAPSVNGDIRTVAVQADGRILVGGNFSMVQGQALNELARLNVDGSLDTGFDPGLLVNSVNYHVDALHVQRDGKILVGGSFYSIGGASRYRIARLNPDGSADPDFDPGAGADTYNITTLADESILLGGAWQTLGGDLRSRIGKLHPDGRLDLTFDPVANTSVYSIAPLADGALVLGGAFTTLGGAPHGGIARLNPEPTAHQNLSHGSTHVTWVREGGVAEVSHTSFAVNTAGQGWTPLGSGTRTAKGWALTNVFIPTNSALRARGYLATGMGNGSAWYVQEVIGAPVIEVEPLLGSTILAESTAQFTVGLLGSEPLAYQWYHDGIPVANSGSISGADSATLTLDSVLGADAGGYHVVITNSEGSVTSRVAQLTVIDPYLTESPVGGLRSIGGSIQFSTTVRGTTPSYQWWKEEVPLVGATNATLTLTNLQLSDAGDYWAVGTNAFGSVTSAVARLTVNAVLRDPSFVGGMNSSVDALALQTDGQVIVGGPFSWIIPDDNPIEVARLHIARLDHNGVLDPDFDPSAESTSTSDQYGSVNSIAIGPDRKIVVGGSFDVVAGVTNDSISRLHSDGSSDPGFTSPFSSTGYVHPGWPQVFCTLVEPDGAILVAYNRDLKESPAEAALTRLHPDGTIDTTFAPELNGYVYTMAVQEDGRIVIGGSFSQVNGQPRYRVARLNADGSLDESLNAQGSGVVYCLVVQPDGRIVLGGSFTTFGGQPRLNIARLQSNGALDVEFNPGANGSVYSLALRADGKIVLGGYFTLLGGQSHLRLGQVLPDGSVDSAFHPSANSTVLSLLIQPDGNLLVGGGFSELAGVPARRLGRLINAEAATEDLVLAGTAITWQRGGSAPEVWRTTFDWSTDGKHWSLLDAGTRVPGGWTLTGVNAPSVGTIRVRGFVQSGRHNGSGWFVERQILVDGPPLILTQDEAYGFSSNRFEFNVRASEGKVIVVEASADLRRWVPIRTNVLSEVDRFLLSDQQAGLYPERFYRAREFEGTLPPPSIQLGEGEFGWMEGQFGFVFRGVPGQRVIMEGSTNLVSWVSLETNTLSDVSAVFSDPWSTNHPARFYRLRSLQSNGGGVRPR